MANPSKKKGTQGENEVVQIFRAVGFRHVKRTSPGVNYDVDVIGDHPVQVLATRPDRGRWLATLPLDDLAALMASSDIGGQVEVKRYAKFSLHTIYEKKFGGT